ncbi:MAG TPA: exopolysaccharide biosynthesis polyprenyl glycosylphosphotransferase [Opitutaceae bacterium]|nr:exopolysaccharide biosynthesis polyprenyl glycosylphosphotransferase [Opitutaceae bacterium]
MTDRRLISALLLLLDFLCVVLVFHIIGWLRGVMIFGDFSVAPLLGPFAVFFLAIHLIDGYSVRTDMRSVSYVSQHIIALMAAMLVMLLITFVFIKDQYSLQSSRAVIALSFFALAPITLSYRRQLMSLVVRERRQRRIVFVGSQASCVEFRQMCAENATPQEALYVAVDARSHESISPLVGLEMHALAELTALLEAYTGRVEAIVLHQTSRDLPFAVSEKLMELHFSGVRTYTLELFHEIYWRKIPLYSLDQTWLFQEGFQTARDPVFERLKRLSDIGLALLGLVVTSPLLLLCGAAIWLGDRGPIFFVQSRVGKNRVPFQIYKFRTMRAGPARGELYTQPADSRITGVGRLLRAARCDELPQLWNVLRGDMSLIGPRAEWVKLVERYEKEIPCYHFRHLVKPGITGWAQVNYPYGANLDDTLRKLEYDLYYIRYFSFVLDASIVLKTIQIMLFGKGR